MLTGKSLKVIQIVLLMFCVAYLTSCGKKNSEQPGGRTETGDVSDINPERPFRVIFDVKGGMTGTVDAVYSAEKSRIMSVMNMNGQSVKSTAFTDGQMVYVVSEIGGMKTGMKMNAKKYSEQSGKEGRWDISSFKDHLKEYQKVGTEEILGKRCDIYQSKDGKFKMSVYKEILPMRFDFGTMQFVATKIEPDIKVDADTFTPPNDVTYIEMDEMLKDTERLKGGMKDLQEKTKELEDALKKYNK